MRTGFVVGKFYPPHHGHKYLIDFARSRVDHLIVMLAHHASQTIPGEVRLAWLREIHPDCDVRLVPDTLDDDSQQWADFTRQYLGFAPDVVFSSEDYGPRFASLMGAQHVMVDRDRACVPISATMIRANPQKYLHRLEPCVRGWFVPRVVLIGAESTGKTTLAMQLAEHFGTNWVAEYGREHWEKKVQRWAITDPPPQWSADEFLHIAQEQQRRETLAAQTANQLLICDTNAFATGTWYERYMGNRDARVDAIGSQDRCDLYLLTEPDVPFVQDGFRDGEHIRHWMHQRFAEQLQAGTTAFRIISGEYGERLAIAVAAIKAVLGFQHTHPKAEFD